MESIKDQILRNLESIVEKTGQLESIEGKIPQIEIDIILKEIQHLYESFKLLGTANTTDNMSVVDNRVDEIINKSEETLSKIESMTQDSAAIENISTDPNTKEVEDLKDTTSEVIKTEVKIEPEVIERKEELKETIGEKLQDNNQSLNDKIAANKPDNSIGSKMQTHPISDLKIAIGINEKFLLTNELFKGNNDEYNKAITKLNQMEGLNSALEVLNSLKLRHQWEGNPEAYETLYDLVKRRYS